MTQSDHLLPWRTVAANIRGPLGVRGRPRAEMRLMPWKASEAARDVAI